MAWSAKQGCTDEVCVLCLQSFSEEFFYAWTFERPVSPYFYVLSGLVLVTIMLFCLFPLAPHPVKLAAVYVSMALIVVILLTLLVRGIVALVTWVALGRSLWLFPHLLSEVCCLLQFPH